MSPPPALERCGRVTDQSITQQLAQLLDLVCDPDRLHLGLFGLLLPIRSLPLLLPPFAGRFSSLAGPLRLAGLLLLGPPQSLLLPLVLVASATTALRHSLAPLARLPRAAFPSHRSESRTLGDVEPREVRQLRHGNEPRDELRAISLGS
ncbi:hypothetical protein GCM10027074_58430 [Streptomyces deserti]